MSDGHATLATGMDDHFETLNALAGPLFDRADQVGFDALRPAEQVLFTVWGLMGQVENGGFAQYFYNSSGDHAAAALASLREIGAAEKAPIAERTIDVLFGGAAPRDREERIARLERLDERAARELEALDESFYASPEDLVRLLYEYVTLRRAQFSAQGN